MRKLNLQIGLQLRNLIVMIHPILDLIVLLINLIELKQLRYHLCHVGSILRGWGI